jgi:hypothetical protein
MGEEEIVQSFIYKKLKISNNVFIAEASDYANN